MYRIIRKNDIITDITLGLNIAFFLQLKRIDISIFEYKEQDEFFDGDG